MRRIRIEISKYRPVKLTSTLHRTFYPTLRRTMRRTLGAKLSETEIPEPIVGRLLLEDTSGILLLEDGSGGILFE